MKNFRIPPYENARMVPDEPDILEFLMQWNDDIYILKWITEV